MAVTITFTPQAYAIPVEGTSTEDEVELTEWLDRRGLPFNGVGKFSRVGGKLYLVTSQGSTAVEATDYLVLFAGELLVMTTQKFGLMKSGEVG